MGAGQSSSLYRGGPARPARPTRPQGRPLEGQYGQKQADPGSSKLVMPVIVLCSVAVAACVAFSSPSAFGAPSPDQQAATPPASNAAIALPVSDATNKKSNDTDALVVSQYTAVSKSEDPDRAVNLRLAAQAIDGAVIEPGQVFSFNDIVGDTETNSDYRIALVVFGNSLSYDRGGGICQVSTALYIAALQADMEIVERHPHTLAPDYAPMGLDATLVYGTLDLQLKNTSAYPIRISAEAADQTVTVKLIGAPLEDGLSINAVSKITEYLDQSGDAIADGDGNGVSQAVYYVAESYRVYYQDGTEIKEEDLSTDRYEVNENF